MDTTEAQTVAENAATYGRVARALNVELEALQPSERARLAKQFPASLIQTLDHGGWQADYLSWSTVVEKLLATLEYPPSWYTVDRWESGTQRVFVTVRLEAMVDGDYVELEATGEADKGDYLTAESRARCRAAALIGCGLHLWSADNYRLDIAEGIR